MQSQQGSEVARLLAQIREEYEAAIRGMSGLSQGQGRHAFITTRMENMGKLQNKLDELVGDGAIAMIVTALEDLPDQATTN